MTRGNRRMTPAVRWTVLLLSMLLITAGCGSDDDGGDTAPDAATDPAPSPQEEGSLAMLEGDWTATVSNPRLVDPNGRWAGGTVTLEGDTVMARYQQDASTHGMKEHPTPAGDFSIACATGTCSWGPFMIEGGSPPYRIASVATGDPPQSPCVEPPDEAWVIQKLSTDEFTFTAADSGGSGGPDGCAETYQVLYDVRAVRR